MIKKTLTLKWSDSDGKISSEKVENMIPGAQLIDIKFINVRSVNADTFYENITLKYIVVSMN